MNAKSLITKIALGVSIVALLFSIVTLVRAIVLGSGVFMACILVVGTAIVVAICAIMLYVLRNYESADGNEETENKEPGDIERTAVPASAKAEAPAAEEGPDKIEKEVDDIIADLESDRSYDLSNFE